MAMYRACLTLLNSYNRQNLTIIRYVRNPLRRGGGPKLLEGTVKSNDEMEGDDFSRISSYKDIMKIAGPKEELRVEKALTSENDFGAALGEQNVSEFKFSDDKRFIKKKIIERKHFMMEIKETNLLTCAAKKQIRFLNELNPNEWTAEALSQHFPITVKGVKKLLKNYFVLKDPDRIQQHDAEIEEKWRALESDQPSKLITPLTRQLWNEGKLNKLNYRSNPNLPSASPEEEKTVILRKPAIGQFSAIVQQYINYKTKTEVKPSEGKEVLPKEEVKRNRKKEKQINKFKFSNYNLSTENEYRNPGYKKSSRRIESFDDLDIVHSQYTTNMKEVKSPKEITSNPQYAEWMEKQAMQGEPQTVKKSSDVKVFTKIPKFKRTNDFKYNTTLTENITSNQNPSFQNRRDKAKHHGSPSVSSKNKNNPYKVGQNVYNEDGQFLYKVPFKV